MSEHNALETLAQVRNAQNMSSRRCLVIGVQIKNYYWARKEAIGEGKQDYRTPPAVTSINVDLPTQQQLHNLYVPLTRCDMQRGPPIQIDAIHIDAFIQQVLYSPHITSARHEQQLHRRV